MRSHAGRVLLVLGLAALALGSWSVEVRWVKGWAGLAWLEGWTFAALPGCLCVALSLLLATGSARRPGRLRAAAFTVLATAVSLGAYELGRRGLLAIPAVAWLSRREAFEVITLRLAMAVALAASGLHAATRLLAPQSPWGLVLSTVALALVLPASAATIALLPAPNGSTDLIHAVKMGYPPAWTCLLLALATAASTRRTAIARS
jgi:hypothetical protein